MPKQQEGATNIPCYTFYFSERKKRTATKTIKQKYLPPMSF
jgi:hypothetical protein